jgi:gluconolactonase
MNQRMRLSLYAIAAFALTPMYAAGAQVPVVIGTTGEIPGVVAGGTEIIRIQEGYNGLDDPIGLRNGTLLFSEPNALRIHSLNTATDEASVFVAESNETHGMTETADGRIISAQAWDGSTRIGVIYPAERMEVLSDGYNGMPYSRPNDLIVDQTGGVYFTDPGLTAGQAEALIERNGGAPLEPRLPPSVYYIPPGGAAVRIEDQMIRPNGIQLNKAETILYVSDSNGEHIIAFDIRPDGLVENRRAFATVEGRSHRDNGLGGINSFADGLTVDDADRLYVATGIGVEVFDAEGAHLGTIEMECVPNDCQNLAFSGPTKQTLYIGGSGALYKIQMLATGISTRAK